jgi:methyl-accepting chemotaxis protein
MFKHIRWKSKLKSFLDGKGGLTLEQATSYKDCGLGKWLYPEGLNKYGNISDVHKLEKVHKDLHDTVRSVISLKNSGDDEGAEREYQKISSMSDEVVSLLNDIQKQVDSMK